jgi:hypothetical protein
MQADAAGTLATLTVVYPWTASTVATMAASADARRAGSRFDFVVIAPPVIAWSWGHVGFFVVARRLRECGFASHAHGAVERDAVVVIASGQIRLLM